MRCGQTQKTGCIKLETLKTDPQKFYGKLKGVSVTKRITSRHQKLDFNNSKYSIFTEIEIFDLFKVGKIAFFILSKRVKSKYGHF